MFDGTIRQKGNRLFLSNKNKRVFYNFINFINSMLISEKPDYTCVTAGKMKCNVCSAVFTAVYLCAPVN